MMMMVAEEENATEPEVTELANKETEKKDAVVLLLEKKKETEKEDTAAAATVVVSTLESLPVELRTDIFSRLDAKTLARFRCVSKPMASFVSTPELISAHRIRSRKNPLLLYAVKIHEPYCYSLVSFNIATTSSSYTGINLGFMPHLAQQVFTCLELICLHDELRDVISVFNPTNKYTLSLPPQPGTHYTTKSIGFGFVPSTEQYKVLRVSTISGFTRDLQPCTVVVTHVFTLGTDKDWRYVEQDPPTSFGHKFPATVDYCLYYLSDKDSVVVKFDLEREEWSILPSLPFTPKSTGYLKELGGNLCLVDIYDDKKHIDIWMLKNVDTYSWAKEYDINLSSCLLELDNFVYALPLAVEENGKLLISMIMNEPDMEWVSVLLHYDPRNKHGEYINMDWKLLPGNNGSVIKPLTFYVDSLLSFEDQP